MEFADYIIWGSIAIIAIRLLLPKILGALGVKVEKHKKPKDGA